MSGQWSETAGPAGTLRFYAAGDPRQSAAAPLLLLCPELPALEGAQGDVTLPYEAVAQRVAEESGWRVVAAMFRGVGGSVGSFSAAGWLEDAGALVEAELGGRPGLRAAGFGIGGAVALALAAREERVHGVACFAVPARLAGVGRRPRGAGRAVPPGRRDRAGLPRGRGRLGRRVARALQPVVLATRLGERPLLVVQGSEDHDVPVDSAVELAAAAGRAELRMVLGAGHWLRADRGPPPP